ncbi:hypothetical protein NA57DRAFT_24875, partial [Rhizodiscina lignyota]
VNVDEVDENQFIYIDVAISSNMQPHQLEGVRFMWREVVTGGEGCLLAHTMGLGKTMQTIAFIHTLSVAAKDPEVSEQLSPTLRGLRTLILCPPMLINNWREEFIKWLPGSLMKDVGKVFWIDTSITSPSDRLDNGREWDKKGGVLLIGYQMFRDLVNDGDHVKRKGGKLVEEERKELAKILLESPTLIIADEAHSLKSISSLLGRVAARFKSTSRIALTGSPLANNLLEYFAMIEWVAPGFLGDATEFRNYYKDPIEQGLYKSSSKSQHRKALKRLHVLNREIAPKVNRANIEVLRGNLKPKLEFVLKVGLTGIQKDLCSAIIRAALANGEVSTANLFKWMALLQLACNHPRALQIKLNAPLATNSKKKPKPKKTKTTNSQKKDDQGQDNVDEAFTKALDDKPIKELIPADLVKELQAILATAHTNIMDTTHTAKAIFAMQVITRSLKLEVKDRVLVFSHSIPTLDYLEELMRLRKIKAARMDGSVSPQKRQGLAKALNEGEYDVLLISTTAGGVGINIPGANRVVLLDFGFNPTHEEQAVGRAYRLGQEKPVFVYRFVTGGTFEEALYNMSVFKTQLAFRVVEKKKISSQALKTSDFLFEPRDVPAEDLDEHIGKDKVVLDHVLEARKTMGEKYPIKAITTTETLQAEFADEELTAEEEREVEDEFKLEK